jgi:hypothetical protein
LGLFYPFGSTFKKDIYLAECLIITAWPQNNYNVQKAFMKKYWSNKDLQTTNTP